MNATTTSPTDRPEGAVAVQLVLDEDWAVSATLCIVTEHLRVGDYEARNAHRVTSIDASG